MNNIMIILPILFVAGLVVFLKCDRPLGSVAMPIFLFAGICWIVVEELPRIDSYDSFRKFAEDNKAPMALLHDDKELSVAYLNKSAMAFYNIDENTGDRYCNLAVQSLIRKRWESNRSFDQFKNAVMELMENKEEPVATANDKRRIMTLREDGFDEMKDQYIDRIVENEFKKIRIIIGKLKGGAKDIHVTLPARLIIDDTIPDKRRFKITQMTAVPITCHSALNWMNSFLERGGKKRYAGYLLTVMTMDLSDCAPDTKKDIRARLSSTSHPRLHTSADTI